MDPHLLAGYRDYQSHLQIQQHINNCNMDLRSVGTLCDAYLRRSISTPALAPLAYTDSFMDSLSQVSQLYESHLEVELGHNQILQQEAVASILLL